MFGGIVETLGKVTSLSYTDGCLHLTIAPDIDFNDVKAGDSIAVNGVCLTVENFNKNLFSFTAVPETLRLTTLGELTENTRVNLERALSGSARVGGHHVQGHIDGKSQILEIRRDNSDALIVKLSITTALSKYIAAKGFIAIDGMSITVIDIGADWFTVTLIPHTQAVTIANTYKTGSHVNIEVDMMAKYIEKMIGAHHDAKKTGAS